jgi:hypothetical protein
LQLLSVDHVFVPASELPAVRAAAAAVTAAAVVEHRSSMIQLAASQQQTAAAYYAACKHRCAVCTVMWHFGSVRLYISSTLRATLVLHRYVRHVLALPHDNTTLLCYIYSILQRPCIAAVSIVYSSSVYTVLTLLCLSVYRATLALQQHKWTQVATMAHCDQCAAHRGKRTAIQRCLCAIVCLTRESIHII